MNAAAAVLVEEETPESLPSKLSIAPALTQQDRDRGAANGHATKSKEGKRERLRSALFVKELTDRALGEMGESLSFSGENAKDNALALAAVGRLWDAAQERIRILKGEALPLGVKVEPKKAKRRALRPAPSAPIRPPADPVPAQAPGPSETA